MVLKTKLCVSLFFLMSFFIYFLLVDVHIATHKINGRIIKVEKKIWLDTWVLILFSDGNVYKIDIENEEDVEKLKTYDEKFIQINYGEYLLRGPVRLKHRLESWQTVSQKERVSDIKDRILDQIDKHLSCSFFAQLQKDKNLYDKVLHHLEKKNFNTQQAFKKCEI